MTLKQAISIAKQFGFRKVTVLKEQSGCDNVFHYFETKINNLQLMIWLDENKNEWVFDIAMGGTYFYNFENVVSIVQAIHDGK